MKSTRLKRFYLPIGHEVQELEPVTGWYIPDVQAEHDDEAAAEYLAGQILS